MKNWALRNDVYDAVDWAVRRTADWAVYEAVCRDVSDAVWWPVSLAVYWAVDRANLDDPEHPAIKDFLREVL
jgi:hypothetical protein